jgi:hypothetical protein
VTPEDEGNAVEIVGEPVALLQLTSNSKNAASLGEAARSIKLVAGTRNQLCLQVVRPRIPRHRHALCLPFLDFAAGIDSENYFLAVLHRLGCSLGSPASSAPPVRSRSFGEEVPDAVVALCPVVRSAEELVADDCATAINGAPKHRAAEMAATRTVIMIQPPELQVPQRGLSRNQPAMPGQLPR